MYNVEFHADDYGISLNNSKRILELVRDGHLDGFSIISNMSHYEECMKLLHDEWDSLPRKPLITVHINLIDGLKLSGMNAASEANQKNNIQVNSWGKLFLGSYIPGPGRAILRNQIYEEVKAQISRVYEDTKNLPGIDSALRLDSHVHTHMIPIVFDAMMMAVKDLDLSGKLVYVRQSLEPMAMFMTTPGIRGTFPAVNLVKNVILRLLSHRTNRILSNLGIEHGLLWGLCMSGHMDAERMTLLMSRMEKYAKKRDAYIEILGHPGIVLESEKLDEYGADDMIFFFSNDRNVEYDGMLQMCNRIQ